MAPRPKFWPRPRSFGLSLASISLPDYIIRQEDRDQAEAKTLRPRASRLRPKFWPRGHFGPRGLNITRPFSVMLSPRGQSGLKTKILATASRFWPRPGLYLVARLHNNTRRSRPGRGQNLEAETRASRPKPRPKFWPRGHFGLEDLTSLVRFQ